MGANCIWKVVDTKTTEEQMEMLGLKESVGGLAKDNRVRWFGHELKRGDDSVLRVALGFEVSGKRKQEWPKKTSKRKQQRLVERQRML